MRSFVFIMAVVAALPAVLQCEQRGLVLKPTEPMPAVQIP
jgi:hypothetical protein